MVADGSAQYMVIFDQQHAHAWAPADLIATQPYTRLNEKPCPLQPAVSFA